MLGILWLIPALPFAGFVVLALVGPRLSRPAIASVGVGSVGLAALLALLVSAAFIAAPPSGNHYTQTLWTWFDVAALAVGVTFYLDALSLVMVLVVTVVGFFIHLYAAEFMRQEEGYNRFFAYMNLFVGMMLTLVLADNLLLLLLGWEGVGLCSYLLIGFWYTNPANGWAARKAFVVTRVGDVALLIGIFLIFTSLGTVQIQDVLQRAAREWPVGSVLAVGAAALLLGGAVGKSAQLPLQTWLPDAMAGPTPVSALIHAATMVTAGVYLIARTNTIFSLAPSVQLTVALVGALTLLYAGCSALTQWDLKRVLAYSTISQIGYMFLALGVGAWSAAIFHFMTHAFFKALLFLGAGSLSLALHHDYDMARMGGLRKEMPLTFWTFLIGSASLAAVPLVTAGYYSKDLILYSAWVDPLGSPWLWAAGLVGALLTSLYTFRMVFLVFFGERRTAPTRGPDLRMQVAMVVLAALSIVGGFVYMPNALGGFTPLANFLNTALPPVVTVENVGQEAGLEVAAGVVALLGIYLAYVFFHRRPQLAAGLARSGWGDGLRRFWLAGWGFDWLYDRVFVRPFVALTRANAADFIDAIYGWLARLGELAFRLLSSTESGRVRWYAAGIAVGAAIAFAIGVWS